MGIYSKKVCDHDQLYDTNSKVLLMTSVTNCTRCYLQLYTRLSGEANVQIHQMKVFDEAKWKRGVKRLQRVRACFDINPSCEKLGIDCDYQNPKHKLKVSKEIPVNLDISKRMIRYNSYSCFPKYKGDGETQYQKQIKHKRKNIARSIKKANDYLDFFSLCYQCGLSFDNRHALNEHENEHILEELGYKCL